MSAHGYTLTIDTSQSGRVDALNPVELLLAALAACMIKGIDRVAPTLGIAVTSVAVTLVAKRPVDAARLDSVDDVVTVGSNADQQRLDLLHKNLMKFGTIFNTVTAGTRLNGRIEPA